MYGGRSSSSSSPSPFTAAAPSSSTSAGPSPFKPPKYPQTSTTSLPPSSSSTPSTSTSAPGRPSHSSSSSSTPRKSPSLGPLSTSNDLSAPPRRPRTDDTNGYSSSTPSTAWGGSSHPRYGGGSPSLRGATPSSSPSSSSAAPFALPSSAPSLTVPPRKSSAALRSDSPSASPISSPLSWDEKDGDVDRNGGGSDRWPYQPYDPAPSPTATGHSQPPHQHSGSFHTPTASLGGGGAPSTSPPYRSATPPTSERMGGESSKRDPSLDLDFGLDLRKFGLDALSDDEEAQQRRLLNKQGVEAAGLQGVDDAAGGVVRAAGDLSEASVHMLSLLYDPPVEGCELRPYISILDPSNASSSSPASTRSQVTVITADSASLVSYTWYKGSQRVCSNGDCRQSASMQCLTCLKLNLDEKMTWLCSEKCWIESWPLHRSMHQQQQHNRQQQQQQGHEEKMDEQEGGGRGGGEKRGGAGDRREDAEGGAGPIFPAWHSDDDDDESPSLYSKFPPPPFNTWTVVSRERHYTPTAEDVGCCLRLEVSPIIRSRDGSTSLGKMQSVDTSPTLAVPPLPAARPVIYAESYNPATAVPGSSFKVVDYNILAEVYASHQLYPYTPIWALQWEYRKHRILAELLSYQADIIALQEVQSNAFDDFFHPQLQQHGYEGLYKRKTRESMSDDPSTIDGCAIFYKADRFSLLEQYGIEYNEAARQQTMDRKALRRLMKGNIALVVVLEELTGGMQMIGGMMRRVRKKRVCVANTHMYWDPDYADVKLWQSYILCQELEKLILHRQLPLVLCGDFNSLVDSSVYEFLMTQQVTHGEDVYGEHGVGDVCHVLPARPHPHHSAPPHHPQLTHHLALTSAYASIGEPKYTNFTGHFVGVLDYVFYSRRHLRWVSVMEVEEEKKVRQYTALPSPLYASDHLPLVVELEWIDG